MAVEKVAKPKHGINVPEGTHLGLFLGLVHLGIQKNDYEGTTTYKDQVLLKFELPEFIMENSLPVVVSKRETNSLSQKANMLKAVKALSGAKNIDDGVDFEDLIGQPVLLELKANAKKTSVSIASYTPVLSSMRKDIKPLINSPQLLFDVDNIGAKELKDQPEWIQTLINTRIKEDNVPDTNADY